MDRGAAIGRLSSGEGFDVLIIGGGAVGLGAAVDAASRGLRTALLERLDFAAGTSSRSTKLIHGGVRYLRQGNIKLVREGLRERGRLAHNAPRLVHALPFIIPCYQSWERVFYGTGMALYDLLAGRQGLGASRMLGARETRERLPGIAAEGLRGGVLFRDGQFDDARLALTLARTAHRHGAVLANYCPVTALLKESGRVVGAQARDEETGQEFAVRARVVINATGVYVDEIRRWDDARSAPMLAVSQGAHLVLPREFLPGDTAVLIPRTSDGRLLFALPWLGRVLIGTTDTPVRSFPAEPRALAGERAFLLEHAGKFLARKPGPEDVLSVYAGLRPLVAAGHKGGATATISREHAIIASPSGLVTVTGGKWTTYRQMGQDVIDRAVAVAGMTAIPSITAALLLEEARAEGEITAIAAGDSALAKPVHPALAESGAELVWHIRSEMARTLEDLLARRTRALLLDARGSIAAAPAVAALLAKELGQSPDWQARQILAYAALARGYVFTDPASVQPDPGSPA